MSAPWTAFAVTVALAGSAATAFAQDSHFRPIGPESKRILANGVEHSVTFRCLVEGIERSDLIVYIVISPEPGTWRGFTRLVSAAGQDRVVMVTLNQALEPRERTAVLGHELQHVSEIAGAPAVNDQSGMRALYVRLGASTSVENVYETRAGQDVERRVCAELRIH